LKAYTRSRTQSSKNTSRSTIATRELLLRSEDDSKILYTGTEEEADEEDGSNEEPYLKHYVGVYNPETGDLDVIEARSMVVRGIVRAHQPRPEDLIAMVISAPSGELG
jgi:DNA-directed RNA polymerase I subunit RPA49